MAPLELRTAAWYGDHLITLAIPASWELDIRRPCTPPPLSDEQLCAALEWPVGQPPIRALAAGRRRPCLVVDDLTRPTPAARVIPLVLRHLAAAGIAAEDVTVVLAKGSHGPIRPGAWEKKIGAEAARRCRLVVHEYDRDLVRVGRTSYGTPVLVNRHVAAADLAIGIGGIYPQHSTGFGGGSKLALGVLGRRSIVALHYGHDSMLGSGEIENSFRRDLDEIAALIRLTTMVSVHVDADRRIVRAVSGDPRQYYRAAVAFSLSAYSVEPPGDADVVLCNAYPQDLSLTFTRSKGLAPLSRAGARASRVAIASNPEGVGLHRLFPFPEGRLEPYRQRARKLRARGPSVVLERMARATRPRRASASTSPPSPPRHPILLYSPAAPALSGRLELWRGTGEELVTATDWSEVLDAIRRQHAGRSALKVVVYPCASIQVLKRS